MEPRGEKIRKAIRWISEERKEDPEKSFFSLIESASLRFNLSPQETEFLYRFYSSGEKEDPFSSKEFEEK